MPAEKDTLKRELQQGSHLYRGGFRRGPADTFRWQAYCGPNEYGILMARCTNSNRVTRGGPNGGNGSGGRTKGNARHISRPDGAKSVDAVIADTVTVKRILPNVITKMNLPVTGPDGQPMSYSLDHKEGGKRLQEQQTLPDAQVPTGTI